MKLFAKYMVAGAVGLAGAKSGWAKGLDSISPGATQSEEGEESSDGAKNGEGSPAVEASATAAMPTKAIQLATSFGWAALSKDSESWNAGGMADLGIAYRLPMKVVGEAMYATFRYAPMDVAPTIKDGSQKYAYTGVVEGFHFGANAVFRIKDRVTATGSAELGYMSASLTDALALPSHAVPDASGVALTLGGGGDWQVVPGFDVGPRLYLGFGTFTSFQLGASGTFAF